MRKRLFLVVLLLCFLTSLYGQRRFATVDPTSISEETDLKFDMNDCPVVGNDLCGRAQDLNFPPNVVFSQDSSRAFVSFPRSDKVMVFDPRSGEALSLIAVGKNPSTLTLSPDGKTLAAVCLRVQENKPQSGQSIEGLKVGTISLIDVDSLQVRNVELNQVQFSFFNNFVFSKDSKTGFIASAGTDQLLRIDIASASEAGPRLQMEGATIPSSITMAPDYSYFAVVLPGSDGLDRREIPDSIQLVDPQSFTVIRSVVPTLPEPPPPSGDSTTPAPPPPPPPDLFASNTVAISADGKLGIITDQAASSSALLPSLAQDRAFLMDMQTGDTLNVFNSGFGTSGPSLLAPDGKTFLLFTNLQIVVVDPENQTAIPVTPLVSNFRTVSRPAFSKDGRLLYIGAPLADDVVVLNIKTQEIPKFVPIGGDVTLGSGDSAVTITSAPMDVSVSPDGQVIAVVDFNANKIDLLENTQRLIVPRLLSTDDWFTGVALTSHVGETANLVLTGFRQSGLPFADNSDTEDVIEFKNPRERTVNPQSQLTFTARSLLESPPGIPIDGWLNIETDHGPLSGFFMTGDPAIKRLDGGLIVSSTDTKFVLPVVRIDGDFTTEINVTNPNRNTLSATIDLFDKQGEQVGEATRQVASQGVLSVNLRDTGTASSPNGLFNDSVLGDFTEGYLVVSTPEGGTAFERFFDGQRLGSLNGIPVEGNDAQSVSTLFAPQVVTFGGNDTILDLIYNGEDTAQISIRLRDNDGKDVVPPAQVTLEPGEMLRQSLRDLFELTSPGPGQLVQGWMEIDSDQEGISGSVEVQVFGDRGLTALPLESSPGRSLVFSHVAQGMGFTTGLEVLNTGSQDANVTVEIHKAGGDLVDRVELVVGAGKRDIRLLKDWFPSLTEQVGGFIRITSDQPVFGVEVFYTNDLETMAAVPAQIVQDVP